MLMASFKTRLIAILLHQPDLWVRTLTELSCDKCQSHKLLHCRPDIHAVESNTSLVRRSVGIVYHPAGCVKSLHLQVDLGGGCLERIEILEDDDPSHVTMQFCEDHCLPYMVLKLITEHICEILQGMDAPSLGMVVSGGLQIGA